MCKTSKGKEKGKTVHLAEVSGRYMGSLSILSKNIFKSAVIGGCYLWKGAGVLAKNSRALIGKIVREINLLKADENVGVKEYILKHKTPPNILVKVPFPKPSESQSVDKSYVVKRLGDVLSTAVDVEDENNLTILSLDRYFEQIKEK